eukprot:241455-Pyramimonas_sp.AAC.1
MRGAWTAQGGVDQGCFTGPFAPILRARFRRNARFGEATRVSRLPCSYPTVGTQFRRLWRPASAIMEAGCVR